MQRATDDCLAVVDPVCWLRGITREHNGADHTLAALRLIRAARPDGYRLFLICDNLAANKTPAIRRWARRENVELCFTPTNASWANPIEAQFGPVRTFVMGGSDHRNHPALARKLQDYRRWRNARARHPGMLAAQRRERARLRSERQQRWCRPEPKAA
jgi:DDE superfamily endonuclease